MKLHDNLIRLFRPKAIRGGSQGTAVQELICASEREALIRSFDMYLGSKGGIGLASGIVSELSSLVLTEFSVDADLKDAKTRRCFDGFIKNLKKSVEYACATGGVIFKPCFDGKNLSVQTVLPFDFMPLGTDTSGNITDCAFIYRAEVGSKSYTRIEEHKWGEDGYVVTNRAYEGSDESGIPCALSAVDKWKDISPKVEIKGLSAPLFSYFGMPLGNSSFPYSPLGVPVFRRAEGLIAEADAQFGRLIWEFEGGELAIDASEDAFRIGKDGLPRLPIGKERLYRTNALDACCSTNELLKTFAPELRDKSIINGLNRIIMMVEDACGIARGTFSDPSTIAKTATEIRSMRQRTYTTVSAIRVSLENALLDLFRAVSDMARLYGFSLGKPSLDISFGDGILTDNESERDYQREDVKCGIITAEEFRQRWYK